MRILQVVTDTDRRGAQVFATDLHDALVSRGHVVATVALAAGKMQPPLDLVTLGSRRLGLGSILALRAACRDVDVVVAHGSSTLPACVIATFAVRTPFVYRQISESLFWAPGRGRRWRVRAYLKRAARVVSLADSAAEVLVSTFGMTRGRVDIVPNGVPTGSFMPADRLERTHARERLGVPEHGFVVLSISALVEEKGVDRVIDAVAALDGGAWLVVAGDGPERDELAARAASKLRGASCFVGAIDDPRSAYAAADVMVLASRGGDSMPATLVEAGFCSVPSVATAVGAIPDVVIDGETGVVLPVDADVSSLAEALGELAADGPARLALGSHAREHCLRHFEIGVVAEKWEAALTKAIRR